MPNSAGTPTQPDILSEACSEPSGRLHVGPGHVQPGQGGPEEVPVPPENWLHPAAVPVLHPLHPLQAPEAGS